MKCNVFFVQGAIYNFYIPTLVFGAQGIGIVLVTLLLPETRGKNLPETMEDAKSSVHVSSFHLILYVYVMSCSNSVKNFKFI